jgi:holo-[acyl-carrier protein] synthase
MTLGIDVVDVERFRALLDRCPAFTQRFFTGAERDYCYAFQDPALRLAGTFAAKEAVMKTLRLAPAAAWARRIEIIRPDDGAPIAKVRGQVMPVSISHDGSMAVAVAAQDRIGQAL